MTTIEKEKALDVVRQMVADEQVSQEVAEKYFPELKESKESEDEKIKDCIGMCLADADEQRFIDYDTNLKECLDWLENQGEQKPVDKVEPKFHEGDWVIYKNDICQIVKREEGCNKLVTNFGIEKELVNERNLSTARFWTIQDAKDGNVLYFNDGHGNDCIELIKSITDKKIEFWFCLTNGNRYEVFDGITPYTNLVSREDATPATKEQRDLLFQKIKEAGYEWNAEKKELKKIESYSLRSIIKDEPSSAIKKVVDSLTAWSEEDESNLDSAIYYVRREPYRESDVEPIVDWLRTLKNRVQPKQAWSEEDEALCEHLIKSIEESDPLPTSIYSDCKRWLKALKDRYTWKPSKEQMEALLKLEEMHVLEHEKKQENAHLYMVIKSLREQLLKLREE